jgi:hypothetical protein
MQDADLVGAEQLGQATFDAAQFLDEQMHNLVLDLVDAQVCMCVCVDVCVCVHRCAHACFYACVCVSA